MPVPHDLELTADCSRCFALCCVVPAFARSADFAIDKPARHACPNLAADFGCGIHAELRPRGFTGCTTYDCFGAGQQVAQVIFGGHDWRESTTTAASMFDVFPVVRALHELLWYLTEAEALCSEGSLRDEVAAALREITLLANSMPDELVALDVDAVRGRANQLLSRVSERVRGSLAGRRPDHRGADLVGSTMAAADLRGANLRGAYLIGTDLRGAPTSDWPMSPARTSERPTCVVPTCRRRSSCCSPSWTRHEETPRPGCPRTAAGPGTGSASP